MPSIILIAIIIFSIILLDQEDKPKPKRIVGYNTQNGKPIYEGDPYILGFDTKTGKVKYDYKKYEKDHTVVEKPTTPKEKTKLSNTIILVTGAILIVVAASVFLASSWNVVSGIVKVLVLLLLQLVFVGFSYLSYKVMKIDKVGNVFKVLSFVFIPIVLLSLINIEEIRELLYDQTSIYLFFGGVLLISDIIYKTYAYFKNEKPLKYTGYLAEILGLFFIALAIADTFEFVMFVLSIHAIIIYILIQGGYLDRKIYNLPNLITLAIYTVLLACKIEFGYAVLNNLSVALIAVTALVEFIRKNEKAYLIIFYICYFFALKIVEQLDFATYFIYILSLIPLLLIFNKVKSSRYKEMSTNLINVVVALIVFFSLWGSDRTIPYLLTFVAAFIYYLIAYLFTKKGYVKLLIYISFTLMFIDLFDMVEAEEITKYIPLIVAILVYLFEYIFEKLKDRYSDIFIIGAILLSSLTMMYTYAAALPLLFMLIYVVLEKKNQYYLILPMLTTLNLLTQIEDITQLIIGIVLVLCYSGCSIYFKDQVYLKVISLISILVFVIIIDLDIVYLFVILLLWSIAHISFKQNNTFTRTVLVLSILGLYIRGLYELDSFYYCTHALGYYLAALAITKWAVKGDNNELTFFEYFIFAVVSIFSIVCLTGIADSIIYLAILVAFALMFYKKEYKSYFYSSIIFIFIELFVITVDYWGEIPWYVYILAIGLIMIFYVLFDEKKKNKIEKPKEEKTDNKK